jgi:hypothetical protein
VLDLSFPISSGEFSGVSVGAVLVKGADLYVAWKGAASAGVDKLDYTAKYASAYIETMMLSAPNDRGLLKTALEACAYYASLPASTGVTFGYKKKYDTDYTTASHQQQAMRHRGEREHPRGGKPAAEVRLHSQQQQCAGGRELRL